MAVITRDELKAEIEEMLADWLRMAPLDMRCRHCGDIFPPSTQKTLRTGARYACCYCQCED